MEDEEVSCRSSCAIFFG